MLVFAGAPSTPPRAAGPRQLHRRRPVLRRQQPAARPARDLRRRGRRARRAAEARSGSATRPCRRPSSARSSTSAHGPRSSATSRSASRGRPAGHRRPGRRVPGSRAVLRRADRARRRHERLAGRPGRDLRAGRVVIPSTTRPRPSAWPTTRPSAWARPSGPRRRPGHRVARDWRWAWLDQRPPPARPLLPVGRARGERHRPRRRLGVLPRLHPRPGVTVRTAADDVDWYGGPATAAELMAGLSSPPVTDGVVVAELDRRPDNLWTLADLRSSSAVLEYPPEGAHVLRLRAVGEVFCLGRERAGTTPRESPRRGGGPGRCHPAFRRTRLVTVAEVQGDAAAFGVGVLAACDVAVAVADAQFCFPEVSIGLAPALVLAWLPRGSASARRSGSPPPASDHRRPGGRAGPAQRGRQTAEELRKDVDERVALCAGAVPGCTPNPGHAAGLGASGRPGAGPEHRPAGRRLPAPRGGLTSMRTIEHWIGGKPTSGTPGGTAPVWNPATGSSRPRSSWPAAESTRRSASRRRPSRSGRRRRCPGGPRSCSRSASWSTARAGELAELVSRRARQGRSPTPAARSSAGWRSWSSPAASRTCSRATTPTRRPPASTCSPSGSRSGVVAGITPFNFPVMVPMWMHPVAIACGNAFVLKPSERDPSAVACSWPSCGSEAGLPDGVFNVVQGGKEVVDALLDHPGVAAVSFVGSTPIARYVHERGTAAGKRVQALGGAKNHAVVLPDADLDFAADHLVAAAFGSAGERCMAISAAVAVGTAGDALVDAVWPRPRAIRSGPGRDAGQRDGPVVTARRGTGSPATSARGERQGARLAVDGRGLVVPGHEDGFFLGPSCSTTSRPAMDAYRDEIFGPVLSVLRADTRRRGDRAGQRQPVRQRHRDLHLQRRGGPPLPARGHRRDDRRQRADPGADGLLLVRGWKDSLFGQSRVHGPDGVDFYTRAKVVTERWPAVDRPEQRQLPLPDVDLTAASESARTASPTGCVTSCGRCSAPWHGALAGGDRRGVRGQPDPGARRPAHPLRPRAWRPGVRRVVTSLSIAELQELYEMRRRSSRSSRRSPCRTSAAPSTQ